MAGSVQLRVFRDRIEATSPGAPPNGVTPESMRSVGAPQPVPGPAPRQGAEGFGNEVQPRGDRPHRPRSR
ncbi:MAG: ATP-binding protein [Solirubrobacteraceae bacterium]